MNIDASKPGRRQNGLWQDQPIGDNHCSIEIERCKRCLRFYIPQRLRRPHVYAFGFRKRMYR